jgi:hypothetical protein
VNERDSNGSLGPAALGAVGKLRECVAAARNLEHLIGSRDIGPKVLEQVLPEVAAELLPFVDSLAEVLSLTRTSLGLSAKALEPLFLEAAEQATQLIEELEGNRNGAMNAKRRLAIERTLKEALPGLSASLSHTELLVEATNSEGVPMSVHELLSSTPDAGSNRPHRRIHTTGPTEAIFITAPARIGLRCLGMLASAYDPQGKQALTLEVAARGDDATFVLRQTSTPDAAAPMVKLPIFPHTKYSVATVEAALLRYGGKVVAEEFMLLLPLED